MTEWLTTAEAAEVIRMDVDYVARLCKSKALPAKKLGNVWRIDRAALDLFMRGAPTPAVRQRRRAS